jgi:hypothetical protein
MSSVVPYLGGAANPPSAARVLPFGPRSIIVSTRLTSSLPPARCTDSLGSHIPFPALLRPGALASLRRCSCQSDCLSANGWGALRTTDARPSDTRACSVVWLVSFPCLCHVQESGYLFFDCRTLPARRGASKRNRLDDHGPREIPRDRRDGRASAFLTRRSFRAGALTPSKTARRE